MMLNKPKRRYFTDAARVAAAEARRRKREMRFARDYPELFVVRLSDLSLRFCWEIRRYGGIVLARSGADFACVRDARRAGEAALSSFMEGSRIAGPGSVARDVTSSVRPSPSRYTAGTGLHLGPSASPS